MRILFPTISLAFIAVSASADITLSIPFRIGATDVVKSQTYSCSEGGGFDVMYVNAGANSLAIMKINDKDRVFVNVVAGSGAKYVSGADVWWIKGDTATMENTLKDSGLLDRQAQTAAMSD